MIRKSNFCLNFVQFKYFLFLICYFNKNTPLNIKKLYMPYVFKFLKFINFLRWDLLTLKTSLSSTMASNTMPQLMHIVIQEDFNS